VTTDIEAVFSEMVSALSRECGGDAMLIARAYRNDIVRACETEARRVERWWTAYHAAIVAVAPYSVGPADPTRNWKCELDAELVHLQCTRIADRVHGPLTKETTHGND